MAPPPISLKSGFSKSTMTPFSIPFNAPASPESKAASPPVLSSRFSDETLASKTPRLPSHRWFSSSPPHSPTKGISSAGSGRSWNESRLDISAPTNAIHGTAEREEEEEVMADEPHSGGGAVVVRGVDEAFEFARGHGRCGSGGSNKSMGATTSHQAPSRPSQSQARLSRSVSSPAPPPRPTRPLPPIQSEEMPTFPPTASQSRLDNGNAIHPPPRSDSRNATHPPRSDSRNGFFPSAPVAKRIAAQATRPHPPPSPATPPHAALGRRTPTPLPPITPFKAVLVDSPSALHVEKDSVRIRLDVGGTVFVTTAETLLTDGHGGKLGQFIDVVLDKVKENQRAVATKVREDGGESIYPSSDDGDSYAGTDVFDHSQSPFPSPFPFMRYDTGSPEEEIAAGLALDADGSIILPSSPSSPIDPFIKRMLPVPPPTTLTTQATAKPQRAEFVPSPLPHLRVNSFHSSIQGSPPSPLSSSTDDSLYSCRHLSSFTDNSHFDTVLEAFHSITSYSPSPIIEIEPVGYPLDMDEKSFVEDHSRSTLLGVPRGSMKLKGPRDPRPRPRLSTIPPVPRLEIHSENDTDGSRPPSLSMSASSGEEDEGAVIIEDERNTLEIFLDRNGKIYEAILDFLRDGQLPSSHSLPHSTLPTPLDQPDVDPVSLSIFSLHPPSALLLLSSLRTLLTEANWLGMSSLVEACEKEMARVVEVVRWFDGKREKVAREKKEKAGWI